MGPVTEADSPGQDDVDEIRWGIGEALIAFGVSLMGAVLVSGIAFAATGQDEGSLAVQLGGIAGLWIGLVGGPVVAARLRGSGSVVQDFGFRAHLVPDVPLGLVVGVACQLLLVPAVFTLVELLAPNGDLGNQAEDLTGDAGGAAFLVKVVVFVVLAPLAEELYFRGLLLRSVVRRYGPSIGIVASSVCFGAAHISFQGTGEAAAALFLALAGFGAVLAALAVRFRRLGPSIVTHMAFNAVTMVALALQ